jgi:SAM-dependent methyltransferase
MLKHARLNLFYKFLPMFSNYFRNLRIKMFEESIADRQEEIRILDLGGQLAFWRAVQRPLDITILNLPGIAVQGEPSHHRVCYVEGDACDLSGYGDGVFDIVFSNSVIEHVGDAERRAAFAREARRVGRDLWIQTPSKWFPVEAHTGMPLWWFYPSDMRASMVARWRRKAPAWTDMVEGTTVVEHEELRRLFPSCEIKVERVAGFPKSYIATTLRPCADAAGRRPAASSPRCAPAEPGRPA